MDEERLTTKEAAEIIGLKPSTLVTGRYYGRGPRFLKVGWNVYYRRSDLEAWIIENRTPHLVDPRNGREAG